MGHAKVERYTRKEDGSIVVTKREYENGAYVTKDVRTVANANDGEEFGNGNIYGAEGWLVVRYQPRYDGSVWFEVLSCFPADEELEAQVFRQEWADDYAREVYEHNQSDRPSRPAPEWDRPSSPPEWG